METRERPIFDQFSRSLEYLQEITRTPRPEWFSPSKIIMDHAAFALREFQKGPDTIVIVPPEAGHASTVADFDDEQSLVQTAKETGRGVYALDWKACTIARKDETIEDMVLQLHTALSMFPEPITLVGLCQAGWLSSIYASLHPEKVKYLVVAGSPINAKIGGGHLQDLVTTYPQSFYEQMVGWGSGVMRGELLLIGWKLMHPVDRMKDYYDLWRAAGTPKFAKLQRFRNWYEYTQNLPGIWYLQVVDGIFRRNDLWEGRLHLFGKPVDLGKIACPVCSIAGENDDITLIPQALALPGRHLVIPKVGHIGIFMSRKSQDFWRKALAEQTPRIEVPSGGSLQPIA